MKTTPHPQRAPVAGQVGQGFGDHRRARVLVVDDDQSIRAILREWLGDSYLIDEARDGYEALAKLNAAAYDMVISDVDMPRLDGIKLSQTIRDLFPGTPVVLMSATYTWSDAARESGAKFFLQKPFNLQLLREVVDLQTRVG